MYTVPYLEQVGDNSPTGCLGQSGCCNCAR